jgi:anti-sigma factor RsiW
VAKDTVTDDLMMRYLLGDISDEVRVRLEEHYFVDDRVFEQLSAFEDELVDDYVRGELTEAQRKQFELHFLNSPERQRKLAFARSFTRFLSNVPTAAAPPKRDAWRQKITDWFGLRSGTARWAFAVAFAAVVFGGAWLLRENWWLRTQLGEMHAQQAELRHQEEQLSRQLAQLKAPAIEGPSEPELSQSRPPSLAIFALTLTPGVLRSGAEQKTLDLPPGPSLVRLRLDIEGQSYETYRVTLETAEGRKVWSKEGLKAILEGKVRIVVLELPSKLLGNKDYIVELSGVRSGVVQGNQHPGEAQHPATEEIAAYSFRVVKR